MLGSDLFESTLEVIHLKVITLKVICWKVSRLTIGLKFEETKGTELLEGHIARIQNSVSVRRGCWVAQREQRKQTLRNYPESERMCPSRTQLCAGSGRHKERVVRHSASNIFKLHNTHLPCMSIKNCIESPAARRILKVFMQSCIKALQTCSSCMHSTLIVCPSKIAWIPSCRKNPQGITGDRRHKDRQRKLGFNLLEMMGHTLNLSN